MLLQGSFETVDTVTAIEIVGDTLEVVSDNLVYGTREPRLNLPQ